MIRLKDVSYKIKDKVIIDKINLKINEQEKILIVGKSGSGKSTLFHLLMHNIYKYEGQIFYKNEDIKKYNEKKLLEYRKEKVNLILQTDDLYNNLTVNENLNMFFYQKDIDFYLKKTNLMYLKDKKVEILSGGERQRIAIIKSCLRNCEVLLCDEITSALDEITAKEIIDFILLLFNDKTIIFISHNKELFIKFINRIITIENGKIINDLIYNPLKIQKNNNRIKVEKNKNKVIFNKGLKKISFFQNVIYLISVICFTVISSFDKIFETIAVKSYQNYFDYNVFEIKNNILYKSDDQNYFISLENEINNSKIYINNNKYSLSLK